MVVAGIPSTNSGHYISDGPNMSSIAQSSSTSMPSLVGEPSSECHCELAIEIEIMNHSPSCHIWTWNIQAQTKLRGLSKRQSIINKLYDNEDMRECMKEVPGVERIRQIWSTDYSNLETTLQNQLKESASRYLGGGQVVISQLCANRQKAECARAFECRKAIRYKTLGPENMEAKSSGNGKDINDQGAYSCNKADYYESAKQLDRRGEDFEDEEDNQFMEAGRSERRDNRGVEDKDEQNMLILGEVQRGAEDERSDAFECITTTSCNESVLKNTQLAAGDSDDGIGEQNTEDQDTRAKGTEWDGIREQHNEDKGERGSEVEGRRRDGCVKDWGRKRILGLWGEKTGKTQARKGKEGQKISR